MSIPPSERGRVWLLWPGLGFPFSAAGEGMFVRELAACAGEAVEEGQLQRDDVTLLMSLLRSGASLPLSLEFAPGLSERLPSLLSAFRLLEAERSASVSAWLSLLRLPRSRALRFASEAARVLPGPAKLIAAAPRSGFEQVRAHQRERCRLLSSLEDEVYGELAGDPDDATRARLADMLFHPLSGGLFRQPGFLPGRVSALSPEGVSLLLPADLPQGRV